MEMENNASNICQHAKNEHVLDVQRNISEKSICWKVQD